MQKKLCRIAEEKRSLYNKNPCICLFCIVTVVEWIFADCCANRTGIFWICAKCRNIHHKVYKPFEIISTSVSDICYNVFVNFLTINAFINVYYFQIIFWTFNNLRLDLMVWLDGNTIDIQKGTIVVPCSMYSFGSTLPCEFDSSFDTYSYRFASLSSYIVHILPGVHRFLDRVRRCLWRNCGSRQRMAVVVIHVPLSRYLPRPSSIKGAVTNSSRHVTFTDNPSRDPHYPVCKVAVGIRNDAGPTSRTVPTPSHVTRTVTYRSRVRYAQVS